MNGVPHGWVMAKLGDVAKLVSGAGFPERFQNKKGLPYPFFKVGNLAQVESNAALMRSEHTVSDDLARELRAAIIPPDSIVFAKIGMAIRLNRRRLVGVSCCIDNNMMAVIPSEAICPRYLLRFLETVDLMPLARSTTVPALRKSDLDQLKIPVPPLNEQHRIVAALEKLLSHANAAQTRLASVPRILKRFHQSVVDFACAGLLTHEWRSEHGYGFEEKSGELIKFARFIDYRGKTPRKTQSGVPLITAKNIRRGYLSIEPREYISEDDYDRWMTRGIPKRGDVLITTEAPLGYVVCVDWSFKFALAQRVICLQFDNRVAIGEYASFVLQSTGFQRDLFDESTGSTVTGIKASRLRKMCITFPRLSEQHEIVHRVHALFKTADVLEARHLKAKVHVDKLTQSILAKAFSGELVPQDPHDETALSLLQRVQTSSSEPRPKARSLLPSRKASSKKEVIRMPKSRYDDDVCEKPYLASLIRSSVDVLNDEQLFMQSELSVIDFYKQLAWEIDHGYIRENRNLLEAA